MSFNSSAMLKAKILAGLLKRSIILVMPPNFNDSPIVSQPNCNNLHAYPASIPQDTILSNERRDAVCNIPQRIVCSPIRSDLTSATKEDSKQPALSPPVPAAQALAISQPSPLGSFCGRTALNVLTQK